MAICNAVFLLHLEHSLYWGQPLTSFWLKLSVYHGHSGETGAL
uniref:Uncharacterized protein n=1 Tax=Anguilla anguilla TaxID=7936 RepID=A0A0E9VCC8_ANGAN